MKIYILDEAFAFSTTCGVARIRCLRTRLESSRLDRRRNNTFIWYLDSSDILNGFRLVESCENVLNPKRQ